jgi:hypothetical protein
MRTGFIAAVVVICAACAGSTVQVVPTSDAWAHYQSMGIGFDHPPEWKERPQTFLAGSFSAVIVILSTRKPDQNLCYRRSMPDGAVEEGCDSQRLGKLAPGDVVLIISSFGRPDVNVLPAGEPLVVNGHDATLNRDDRSCAAAMGGDDAVTLTISQSPSRDFLVLDACGLNVPGLEGTMRRLAASMHIAPLGA